MTRSSVSIGASGWGLFDMEESQTRRVLDTQMRSIPWLHPFVWSCGKEIFWVAACSVLCIIIKCKHSRAGLQRFASSKNTSNMGFCGCSSSSHSILV